jgi:quinoprotein glucose dehydrogenase
VIGYWRPLDKREPGVVAKLVEEHLPVLLSSTSGKLQIDLTKLIDRLKIKTDETVFLRWINDKDRSAEARIAALHLLANRKSKDLSQAMQAALASEQPTLRATARDLLCDAQTPDAFDQLKKAIDTGTTLEKQRAIRALPRIKQEQAMVLLGHWFERLSADQVPAELQLDVLEAARQRRLALWSKLSKELERNPSYEQKMKYYRVTLHGGDAQRGRQIFMSHPVAQCIRCHKVDGHGGDAGPDLSLWAPKAKGDRVHFLESMLYPSKKHTPGYGSVVFELKDGKIVSGTFRSEDKEKVTIVENDGKVREIPTNLIAERFPGISPMPEIGPVLTMDEFRDVIEFLATLK